MAAEMLHEQQQQVNTQKIHHHPDIDINAPAAEKPPQLNNLDLPKKKTLNHVHPGPPASRPQTPQDIVENREKGRLGIPSSQLSIDDFELLKTLGTGKQGRRGPH